jgi:hypothetical protein
MERERGRGRGREEGESMHSGLLNGTPYASWWRARESKGEVDSCPFRERKTRTF